VPSDHPVLSAGNPEYFRMSTPDVPVYERHVLVCTSGEWCPTIDGDGLGVHSRLKSLVKAAGLDTDR
jgi:hypothetical protein